MGHCCSPTYTKIKREKKSSPSVNSEKVVSYNGMEVMEHFMGLIFWSSVETDITPDEDIVRRLDRLKSGFGVYDEMNYVFVTH